MKHKQDPEMSNITRENHILEITWDIRWITWYELHDIEQES